MRPALYLLLTLAGSSVFAQAGWYQWGRDAQHESFSPAFGHRIERIEARLVLDPFADEEKAVSGGNLLVHYQVPIVDGDDLFVVTKTGAFTGRTTRETQIWNVVNHRREQGRLVQRWTFITDWKPVPSGGPGPNWEPVYHTALSGQVVWAPGAGGTMHKIDRRNGAPLRRVNPFGSEVNSRIFVTGPPVVDDHGNVFYNAIQLADGAPWSSDVLNSWLVRIAADDSSSVITFAALTPNAPAGSAQCTAAFPATDFPHPPALTAVAPAVTCGSQRPGINIAPAVAPDGTIYTVSRAHFNDRWGFLIAVNPNMTPKWSASLRNRFNDGCNVLLPPNGTPGGCRAGATTGVDPSDNEPGSGRVNDNSTSSPVVTPDGNILYGAYSRYNYSQGHLMMFGPAGTYLRTFPWGWDLTPAIYRHDGTYSIVLKENHYGVGSYCGDPTWCPSLRSIVTPQDPEQYFITQLDPMLRIEWQYKNTETRSCERLPSGAMECVDDHPNGFEWCVNAIAVDARGVVYANSEDGHLYAIPQGAVNVERLFLHRALGAAYTPLSIGPDGRIYTQNDGDLFIVGRQPRRVRAVR